MDAIDRSIDSMIEDDGWAVAPMIDGSEEKSSRKRMASDDARRILADHFRQMDVDALAEKLALAVFAARTCRAR